MQLLAYGIPHRDESAFGLLHRTAAANGYINTNTFLSAHTPVSSINSAVTTIGSLKSDSGKIIHGKLVEHFVYKLSRHEKPTARFRKVHIDRNLLRTKERHTCPQCLAEKGYSSYLWDYELITTCIQHKRQLVSKCNRCKKPFSWNETTLLGCECDGLARSISVTGDELKSQTKLAAWLKSGAQDKITDLESIYFSLEKVFSLLRKKISKRNLIMLSIKSLSERDSFIEEFTALLRDNPLPNRIKLCPILACKQKVAKELGKELLQKLMPTNITESIAVPRVKITIDEAASILNISSLQLKQLVGNNVLPIRSRHHSRNQTNMLSSTFQLLIKLNSIKTDSDSQSLSINTVVKNPNYHIPLANIIKSIIEGENSITTFDLDDGLLGIRLCEANLSADIKQSGADYLSIKEAAKEFRHSEPHLRILVNTGFLKVIKASGNTSKQLIHREDMIRFDRLYIIGPELASKACKTSNTFCLKLMAFGIEPIMGPSIDDTPLYLFKKTDLVNLDVEAVENTTISHLPYRPGRPVSGDKRHNDLINLNKVKRDLNIDVYQLRKLLGKQILKKHPDHKTKAFVTKDSFLELRRKLNSRGYISLDTAIKRLQIEKDIFKSKFIQTRLCRVEDVCITKVIMDEEFNRIQDIHKDYLISAEVDAMFSDSRLRINNLQKQGLIQPAKQLDGWRNKINLWSRKEVANLLADLGTSSA